MHRHNEVEAILNALQKESSVIDINVEFAFECVMNEHAGLNVNVVILRVPVCLECHRYAIPTLGVNVAKAVAHTLDDALGQNSWLNKESRIIIQVFIVIGL